MRRVSPLFADLYELTMAHAYRAANQTEVAVFEAFFRKLPPGRRYVVASGLGDVLQFLEDLSFDGEDIEYVRALGLFPETFLEFLRGLRFSGDVWAVPEGTVVFPHEPLIQVVAPIIESQLVETYLLNQLHLQSVLATKAARIVQAAEGRDVVEFGARRAHGRDAAMKAARATYLAGGAGTSNLLAAKAYGIPAFGTMAHSFIQAFDREEDAFEIFARLYSGTTLLVDTYDTLHGVEKVIDVARRLGDRFEVAAIRLDSGDLGDLSKSARAKLDAAGLQRVKIFASSGLDEESVADLLASGSPIDGFGVGTHLSASSDAPTLDLAYKLVEYAGEGRTKLSSKKVIYPGRKQVFRMSEGGRFAGDVIGRADELLPGEPLLTKVMEGGRILLGAPTLEDSRRHFLDQAKALPDRLRSLDDSHWTYPVDVSEVVQRELQRLREALRS